MILFFIFFDFDGAGEIIGWKIIWVAQML